MKNNGFEIDLIRGWKIAVDNDNAGKQNGWAEAICPGAVDAVVPGYICDSIDSFTRGVAWYWNKFDLEAPLDEGYEYFIKAGYTEWLAEYWLNGVYIGSFTGLRLNYELDITKAVKEKGNLLAVRILSPSAAGIDGWMFGGELLSVNGQELVYSPCNIVTTARNVNSEYGGILYPMHVIARPRLRTGRVVVKSDMHSGEFSVSTEFVNHTGNKQNAVLGVKILSDRGENVWSDEKAFCAGDGIIEELFSGKLEQFKLWDVRSPYLYTVVVTVTSNGQVIHTNSVRFGFRDFRVKDGFFYLNDRRIFLKCANTSFFAPIWLNKPWDKQCIREEMIKVKAMGHNAIRYLCCNVWPEILDLCDEIGLMVYQEHAAAWEMHKDNPYFEEQFDFHVRGVLRRDINHPSFTMFGLINESHSERERDCAQNELKQLRKEDDSRLVLYGSGRWDARWHVGSVSNPGSWEWECVWGAEDPNAPPFTLMPYASHGREDLEKYGRIWGRRDDEMTCWIPEQGDTHIYPRVPMSERAVDIIRTHSAGQKPAFISEGSHNSMANPIQLMNKAEEAGFGNNKAFRWMDRIRANRFKEDFVKYGLDELYGVAEDVIYASYPLNAKQRRLFMDCVRSNPQIAGLCYTQIPDFSGAGMISADRDMYKPYMCDTVSSCFAPLHWCIFVNPTHVYRGKVFTVEAVLANEDVLSAGDYPVTAKIVSKEYGKAWEYHTVLTIPEVPRGGDNPLAIQVFKENVIIDLPEDSYELTVYMERGGSPSGGRITIPVTEPKPLNGVSAAMIGLTEDTKNWLKENGVEENADSKLILVGVMPDEDAAWDALYKKVRAGANAVMLLPETLLKDVKDPFDYEVYVPERLPFENKGKLTFADNWHYHTYGAVKAHPYTRNLQKGLMDDDYYMQATPQMVLFEQDVPDEIAALTIGQPYYTHSTEGTSGYLFGTALSTYYLGEGRLTLNCFKLFDQYGDSPNHQNLRNNPAADRLLLNVIAHESSIAK